jgi:hypothetical protein
MVNDLEPIGLVLGEYCWSASPPPRFPLGFLRPARAQDVKILRAAPLTVYPCSLSIFYIP